MVLSWSFKTGCKIRHFSRKAPRTVSKYLCIPLFRMPSLHENTYIGFFQTRLVLIGGRLMGRCCLNGLTVSGLVCWQSSRLTNDIILRPVLLGLLIDLSSLVLTDFISFTCTHSGSNLRKSSALRFYHDCTLNDSHFLIKAYNFKSVHLVAIPDHC